MANEFEGNPQPAEDATPSPPRAPRNILLFSDGTGNSSAKLQKTNVWRLYEAADLGYPTNGAGAEQIAYYDDGVGTSAFRLLAAMGGVFGFGLARNIRDLYKFLSRNYQHEDAAAGIEPDRIYAFGFSRGAYTIRLLVSLVTSMGVLRYDTEENLDLRARDMWREYRRCFHTNNCITDFFVGFGRTVVRGLIRGKRWLFGQVRYADRVVQDRPNFVQEWWDHWVRKRYLVCDTAEAQGAGPKVAFVGVWDTVAAYGGPFVEVTRAIDEWIWPLAMPNYRLSEKVEIARHALAIDDKRDAFQPLLWDEVHEATMPGFDADKPRLQQVWFAGMHSDVGGGYSDDSLAYVSLMWMIEHAEKAGVRLLTDWRKTIAEFRNVYGTIHDSRGGGGSFYRYQPRYINAWIDHAGTLAHERSVQPATQIYRDLSIERGHYRTRGFLRTPIRLHASVEERLERATDGYGPNNLPIKYIADLGVAGTRDPAVNRRSSLPHMLELGDRIKLRRLWYFAAMIVAVLIAIKPVWGNIYILREFSGTIDARTDAQMIESGLSVFLPEFAERWTHALAGDPYVTALLVILLLGATAAGVGQERRMIDLSRAMWRARFAPPGPDLDADPDPAQPPLAPPGPMLQLMRAMRRNDALQAALALWKWRVLPFGLGFLLCLFLLYVALAAVTQVILAAIEPHAPTCAERPADGWIPIDQPCTDTGFNLEKNRTYLMHVEMRGPADDGSWRDGGQTANPKGWDDPQGLRANVARYSSKFLRRVVGAPLMAPVIELRTEQSSGLEQWLFGDRIHMIVPPLQRVDKNGTGNVWAGRFRAPPNREGRALFFVNDALFLIDRGKAVCVGHDPRPRWTAFDLRGRYYNNCGYAKVTITADSTIAPARQP